MINNWKRVVCSNLFILNLNYLFSRTINIEMRSGLVCKRRRCIKKNAILSCSVYLKYMWTLYYTKNTRKERNNWGTLRFKKQTYPYKWSLSLDFECINFNYGLSSWIALLFGITIESSSNSRLIKKTYQIVRWNQPIFQSCLSQLRSFLNDSGNEQKARTRTYFTCIVNT